MLWHGAIGYMKRHSRNCESSCEISRMLISKHFIGCAEIDGVASGGRLAGEDVFNISFSCEGNDNSNYFCGAGTVVGGNPCTTIIVMIITNWGLIPGVVMPSPEPRAFALRFGGRCPFTFAG